MDTREMASVEAVRRLQQQHAAKRSEPRSLAETIPCASPSSSSAALAETREEVEARERERRTKAEIAESWRASGFYPRHKRWVYANQPDENQARAVGTCLEVCKRSGTVLLIGDRGTTKTTIACYVAMALLRDGTRPRYLPLADLFAHFKAKVFGDDENEVAFFDRMASYGLLVIDECQERYDTQFEDLTLTRLIDRRYGFERPTVLIANLKPEELEPKLGRSILSRVSEDGGVIVCDWPSYRGRTATNAAR